MISRTPLVVVLALVGGIAAITARQQVRDNAVVPSGSAVVSGTLTLAGPGKQPARRVRVTLNEVSNRVVGLTTSTDDDGHYVFTGVAAGRYDLEASRNGYLRASYGASRPDRAGTPVVVRDGETVANLAFTIAKGGVIAGTVRDPRGRAVPGVTLRVLRLGYNVSSGEPTATVPTSSFVAVTDDRGEYRAFGLPPGGYVVVASPGPNPGSRGAGDGFRVLSTTEVQRAMQAARSGGGASINAPVTSPASPAVGYAPIFYPDVTDVTRATAVTIGVAEERTGIDLVVAAVPTSRVSGVVSTPTGEVPPALQVAVAPTGPAAGLLSGAGLRLQTTFVEPNGTFTIGGVPAGRYTLRVSGGRAGNQGPSMSATIDLTVVPGTDVTVPIKLTAGIDVTGRVVFEGEAPTPAQLETMQFILMPVGGGGATIYTGAARGQGPATAAGRVNADGRFTFTNIAPDTYYVFYSWTAPGAASRWGLARTVANGRDVFDGPMRVSAGEPVELTATFTSAPTVLEGTFQDRGGRAATDYYVLLVSADRRHWVPGSRRSRMTRPATDGAFDIRGLPPGEYLLGALTDLEPGEWHDPAMLEQLSKWAIKVVLRDGQTTTQDIRIGG